MAWGAPPPPPPPPAEFQSDHAVFIGYFDRLTNVFREVKGATEAGDLQTAQMAILGIEEVVCEAQMSFSSPDFKSLVRVSLCRWARYLR